MNAAELETAIRTAFRNVKLDGGTSLRQAEVMDNYGRGVTDKEFAALPQQEITEGWEAIPEEALSDYCYLSHLDSKGFRYYIPAFMLSSLRGYELSDPSYTVFCLYPKKDDSWDYSMMHYSLLDEEQRRATAHFLKWMPDIVELDEDDRKRAERALRNFWHDYL